MGCGFCATGQAGFDRHLSTGRDRRAGGAGGRDAARPAGRRLSNVVFMGMGEPLANYDRTLGRRRAAPRRPRPLGPPPHGLDGRASCPGIRRLAAEDLPVNLAVSLHAANDELRDELVPINRRYPLAS